MKTKYLMTFLVSFLFIGCKEEIGINGKSKFFAQEYILVENIELSTRNSSAILGKYTGSHIASGDYRFDKLSIKFKDLSYNKRLLRYSNIVIGDVFSAIEIVSDADFDETHPAGTSLADVFMFYGLSPFKFIQSGYKDYFDWENYQSTPSYLNIWYSETSYSPVNKLASQMTEADFKMLKADFQLAPLVTPAIKEHKLTITLRNSEKTITGTVEVVFR